MTQIFCRIRKEWVAKQPEEIVRQNLLCYMIEEQGFPPALIAVEKALNQMPHLALVDKKHIPKRRADIVVFARGIHPQFDLHPLVMVECKAVKITPRTMNQVIGYNHCVNSPFIVLVNEERLITGWRDKAKGNYQFINHLPSYVDLCKRLNFLQSCF